MLALTLGMTVMAAGFALRYVFAQSPESVGMYVIMDLVRLPLSSPWRPNGDSPSSVYPPFGMIHSARNTHRLLTCSLSPAFSSPPTTCSSRVSHSRLTSKSLSGASSSRPRASPRSSSAAMSSRSCSRQQAVASCPAPPVRS
jgi:hypothetical protein